MQKIYQILSGIVKKENCAAGIAAYESPARSTLQKPQYLKHIAIDKKKKEK